MRFPEYIREINATKAASKSLFAAAHLLYVDKAKQLVFKVKRAPFDIDQPSWLTSTRRFSVWTTPLWGRYSLQVGSNEFGYFLTPDNIQRLVDSPVAERSIPDDQIGLFINQHGVKVFEC